MDKLYSQFREIIRSLFINCDISFILKDPLKSDFSEKALADIERGKSDKVSIFFERFESISSNSKYEHLLDVTKDVSEWVVEFLLSDDGGHDANMRFQIMQNLINLHDEFYVENLNFTEGIIGECVTDGLISSRVGQLLNDVMKTDGPMYTKWKFLDLVHVKSINCYAKFLNMSYKYNKIFVELFCEDLCTMLESAEGNEDIRNTIQIYSNSIIDMTVNHSSSQPEAGVKYQPYNAKRAEKLFHKIDAPVNRTEPLSQRVNHSSSQPEAGGQYQSSNAKRAEKLSHKSDAPVNRTEPLFHIDTNYSPKGEEDEYSSDEVGGLDYDDIFGELREKAIKDILNFRPEPIDGLTESLTVRQYQGELAEKGIAGCNVLICAPTSSGKTIVAIKITEEHFKTNTNGKVVFIVPTNELVDQQYKEFRKYLKNHKIIARSGNAKCGNISLNVQIPNHDIFILTCEILRNALEEEDSPSSIADFTLIIFDECHHTDKAHPYNKMMNLYFHNKNNGLKVPQIIGMTASTGTGQAKSAREAMDALVSLCGNLDCHVVSTVKLNIADLMSNINVASHEIQTPENRSFDDFEGDLLKLMSSIEDRIKILLNQAGQKANVPDDKWHDKYINFIKSLSQTSLSVSPDIGKELRNVGDYLEILHGALRVNYLFTSTEAFRLIEEDDNKLSNSFHESIQPELKDFLTRRKLDQNENPSLECLKKEIFNQLKKDKDSRIIVFVKKVTHAKIMENLLNSTENDLVRAATFVGTNKSSDQGGSTNSVLSETLGKFRKGLVNVLCCTSVAEEGLQIEKCNLVIRYADVTNEISMVQSRGRANDRNSRYVVIIPQRLNWQVRKENTNKHRERMMYQAIDQFQNMEPTEVARKIEEYQITRQLLWTAQRITGAFNRMTVEDKEDSTVWKLYCRVCESYLCDSTDMRVMKNSHVVINKEKFPNLVKRSVDINNSKIMCLDNHELGYVHKHDGVSLPCIQVKKCLMKCGNERRLTGKWKDAPFPIKEATKVEVTMAYSLLYVE